MAPKTVTFGIVARDAQRAVILRRGPVRHTRMLIWDLHTDEITPGQWLVGAIDPWPCGLSPSGDLLVYEARKGGRTFTAICRPPYFTALAYWDYVSPWPGGGFFSSDRGVVLGLPFRDPYAGGAFPSGFEVTDIYRYFAKDGRPLEGLRDVIAASPEANKGWSGEASGVFRKANPKRRGVRLERTWVSRHVRSFCIVDEERSATHALGILDWADWAHDGTLLLGRAGKLERHALPRTLASAGALEDPRLVADLTGQRFEHVLTPNDARDWPGSAGGTHAKSKSKRRRR
jgi:hypothetical protein